MEAWNMNTNPLNFNNPNNNFMYNGGYVPPAQRYEVIRVNGEAGARNFRMAPNSNALLLDNTANIIWFAQTDGTGYLTVTPYDILPHQQAAQIDVNDLAARVTQLEEIINAKSNFNANKQSKKQRNNSTTNESASDSAG